MKIGIVGLGQIGKSFYDCHPENMDTSIYDPFQGYTTPFKKLDIINICTPFVSYEKFKNDVGHFVDNSRTIIIHSTVDPGTTKQLSTDFPEVCFVYSPCCGVHPNLTESFKTFDKYLGVDDHEKWESNIEMIYKYFKLVKIPVQPVSDTKTIEFMKVLSTSMYSINIAMMFEIEKMCKETNTDFTIVYTKWQESYNKGYTKLGKGNVCRPILKLPEGEDRNIGGHCCSNNAVILDRFFKDNWMSNVILGYSDKSELYINKNL